VVDVVRGSVCGVRVAMVTQVFLFRAGRQLFYIEFPVASTGIVAFFGVVKGHLLDRDACVSCLRSTFPRLSQAEALPVSLLNHQRQYVDRFRAMSSASRPRQVPPPPPKSLPRPRKLKGRVSLPVATVSVKPQTFQQGFRAGALAFQRQQAVVSLAMAAANAYVVFFQSMMHSRGSMY
jgi:hypothetical protein